MEDDFTIGIPQNLTNRISEKLVSMEAVDSQPALPCHQCSLQFQKN